MLGIKTVNSQKNQAQTKPKKPNQTKKTKTPNPPKPQNHTHNLPPQNPKWKTKQNDLLLTQPVLELKCTHCIYWIAKCRNQWLPGSLRIHSPCGWSWKWASFLGCESLLSVWLLLNSWPFHCKSHAIQVVKYFKKPSKEPPKPYKNKTSKKSFKETKSLPP